MIKRLALIRKAFLKLWTSLSNNGVGPNHDFDEIKRIKIVNQASFMGIFISVTYFIILICLTFSDLIKLKIDAGLIFDTEFLIVLISVCTIIFLLVRKFDYKIGAIFFFILIPGLMFSLNIVFGKVGSEYYYFSFFVLLFYILRRHKSLIFLALYMTILFGLAKFFETSVQIPKIESQKTIYFFYANVIFAFISSYVFLNQFITEYEKKRKELEEKNYKTLVESRELYKLLAEKMTDVVWLMDLTGKSIFVSPSIINFTGFTEEEYLAQTIEERFTSDSALSGLEFFADEIKLFSTPPKLLDNYSKTIQLEYVCKNNQTKWGELIVTPYYSSDSKLMGIHGVTRDISERKQAEDEILLLNKDLEQRVIKRTAQHEKAVIEATQKSEEVKNLLKELSHRTKNNLQLVSSMLNIQANKLKDSEAKTALQEGKNRIASIALLHQKLYISQNLTKVSFKVYIDDLISHLIDIFDDKSNPVEIIKDVDDFDIKIDNANTLGLIVNELLTNSFKHGIISSRENYIKIHIQKLTENQIKISIADSGKGIDSLIDNIKNKDSFGMELITALVRQMDGDILINANDVNQIIIKVFIDK